MFEFLGELKVMKKRSLSIMACLLPVLCLTGCMWARQKVNIEDFHTKAEAVVEGKTKAGELEGIFGSSPNAIIPQKEGKKVYVYSFGDGKTNGLNLILVNIRKTNLGMDSGYFFIDQNGVVEEKIISSNSKDVPWQWWAFGD